MEDGVAVVVGFPWFYGWWGLRDGSRWGAEFFAGARWFQPALGMPSGPAVTVDPTGDPASRQRLRCERDPVDKLGFQGSEPAFRYRVIVA